MEKILPKILVDHSTYKYYKRSLDEIRSLVSETKTDEALKKIDKLSEFIDDDIEYIKLYAEEFPLDEIREIAKECIENNTIPMLNDDDIYIVEYKDFVLEGPEGTLYDLNRNLSDIYATYSTRSINDIGCSIFIKHLINENNELKEKLKEGRNNGSKLNLS